MFVFALLVSTVITVKITSMIVSLILASMAPHAKTESLPFFVIVNQDGLASYVISTSTIVYLTPVRMLVAVLKLRCKFSCDGFAYCIARWPQLVEDAQKSIVAATRRPGQTDVDAIKHLFMVQVRFFNEIQ